MRFDKLENIEEIVNRLFDPRKNNKYIPLKVKYMYLHHFLNSKWKEICGPALAGRCSIYKIEGHDMHIRVANSMLANELYMMQDLFLQKINAFLLGRIIIKKLYFHTGFVLKRQEEKQQLEEYQAQPAPEYTKCPKCGCRMEKGIKMCSVCEREEKEKLRSELAELLRIQPWLKYEDCNAYYKCDKILFTAVKDSLKSRYFEKVRLGYATKKEALIAVLFLTEKHPDDLTLDMCNNAIEYLRRNQDVSASGRRFYGKK